ncbi:unnamed protein product [Somion occarium]|uniref:Protein kinase domain-containing protein n=1 Tax=Somion occarium TaxID=3059160 RepID=A0ABP1E7J9_9APHY
MAVVASPSLVSKFHLSLDQRLDSWHPHSQKSASMRSPYYYPQFLWKFFLNPMGPKWSNPYRIHVYDVFNDALIEMRRIPKSKGVFAHFAGEHLDEHCLTALKDAEESFTRLESAVEKALTALLRRLSTTPLASSRRGDIHLDAQSEYMLRKFLIFLRYRNSEQYLRSVDWAGTGGRTLHLFPLSKMTMMTMMLQSVQAFLDHDPDACSIDASKSSPKDIEDHCWKPMRETHTELSIGIACEDQEFIITDRGYGNLDDVDPDGSCDNSYHLFFPLTPTVAVYLVTTAPSLSYGSLSLIQLMLEDVGEGSVKRSREVGEDGLEDEEPILKKLRVGGDVGEDTDTQIVWDKSTAGSSSSQANSSARDPSEVLPKKRSWDCQQDEVDEAPDRKRLRLTEREDSEGISESDSDTLCDSPTISISYEAESVADVHMRNAILLRTSPRYILFSSLPSLITSITALTSTNANFDSLSTDGLPLSTSLSRLRTLCRKKHIREGLMKTLVLKGDMTVTDLTDDVKVCGEYPELHGSFADIWKGEWNEKGLMGVGGMKRIVALKVLRQHMKNNVKEKLLKRLKYEVLTWYRLRHPHIIQFYGIVRWPQTLAMVSPWCKNGTVVQYLKEINPDADRLALIAQIASGVAYLHNFEPVVIHGDLKGNNILVDGAGRALIADFGVSNVIEDFASSGSGSLAESLLGGAVRWIAPEIIHILVQDNGRVPELTKASDVYAFAAVCLEIVTGKLPYPHRSNACVVIIDKMAGVKPCYGVSRTLQSCPRMSNHTREEFWAMLDHCWKDCDLRPSMSEMEAFFTGLANAEQQTSGV